MCSGLAVLSIGQPSRPHHCLPSACEYVLFLIFKPIGTVLPIHTHLSFRHDSFQIAAADFVEQLFSPTLDVLRVQQPWTAALADQFTEPRLALNERRES